MVATEGDIHSSEVNSRIHDLHLQFVAKSGSTDSEKIKLLSDSKDSVTSQRTESRKNELDKVLGDNLPKVKVPDSNKIVAILREHDPLVLQKHLLTSTVQNQLVEENKSSKSFGVVQIGELKNICLWVAHECLHTS
ncbi:hypothetical protein NQ315_000594 [Exocentrus adspersus]|uniref:Uncharacterized protein n=1 Tax=Exocentrus adspersus TaxID=1586481 RepID=A0AAV8VDB3_9CUCU|nr:hypothetical protein NQ315_000594 [Exocentrus adspersus]